MANLVIDIGNTALKAAWAEELTLGRTYRYQGERIMDFIISLTAEQKPEIMVLSSVRNFSKKDVSVLKEHCGKFTVVDESVSGKYDLPEYLTPDRTASLIAARHLFKNKGCTVFDLGAMLTVDFIDKEGKYLGGNVSLGCRTRFKSLHRYSKNLPLLQCQEDVPEIGKDVFSSIHSGVISGMVFELTGYLSQNPENIAVFTGGDAIYFAKRMKNSIFVVCNLVHMGLALIALEYDKKD
jgi:type III pantothenate kinase